LYGGNDGLNTVVPYQDPLYKKYRSDVSLDASQVLPLGQGLGLNGTMVGFKTLWDRKELAIIRGVGYPKPDRSHFSSMAIWQSGDPITHQTSGWIGRWLDTQPHDPFTAIGLGSVIPPLLVGNTRVGSVLPLGGLVVPNGDLANRLKFMSRPSNSDSPLSAAAAANISDLLAMNKQITPILKGAAPKPDDLPSAIGSNFGGDTSLTQQLSIVAKMIAANAPTRVWAVSLGGFDTHADEVKSQSALVGNVSTAITQFLSQIHTTGHRNDVTVLVYSEFGRRVAANASHGTDHGTAGPVFLMGSKVKGGQFYGDEPSLSQLNNGDLAVTTDFRDVYGAVLEGVLGQDETRVLNKWSSKLNAFA